VPIDGKKKSKESSSKEAKKAKKVAIISSSESEEEEEDREEGEIVSENDDAQSGGAQHSEWSDSEESGEENEGDAETNSSSLLKKKKKLPKPVPSNSVAKSVAEAMKGAGKKGSNSPPSPSTSASSSNKKRRSSDSKTTPTKKPRENEEVSHPDVANEGKKDGNEGKKKRKGEPPIFSDKNCDVDLFHSSPTNVVPKRIKISNNMIVTCRLVEQTEQGRGLAYDYAAITFQRKTGNEKLFEFIVPLNLAPRIIEALKIIVKENHKFFQSGSM